MVEYQQIPQRNTFQSSKITNRNRDTANTEIPQENSRESQRLVLGYHWDIERAGSSAGDRLWKGFEAKGPSHEQNYQTHDPYAARSDREIVASDSLQIRSPDFHSRQRYLWLMLPYCGYR
jgi:hypothetical protein